MKAIASRQRGWSRLWTIVGLGPFGRRLGGGPGGGGIGQWIGEVFVDDRRKFGCAHEIVVAVAGNDREPRLRELGVLPAGLLHAAAEQSEKLRNVFELCRQTSIYPRQYLLQGRKELLPPALGALVPRSGDVSFSSKSV